MVPRSQIIQKVKSVTLGNVGLVPTESLANSIRRLIIHLVPGLRAEDISIEFDPPAPTRFETTTVIVRTADDPEPYIVTV